MHWLSTISRLFLKVKKMSITICRQNSQLKITTLTTSYLKKMVKLSRSSTSLSWAGNNAKPMRVAALDRCWSINLRTSWKKSRRRLPNWIKTYFPTRGLSRSKTMLLSELKRKISTHRQLRIWCRSSQIKLRKIMKFRRRSRRRNRRSEIVRGSRR